MRAYVGITDWDWYQLLRNQQELDEANFWQPSGSRSFRILKPGELFLFKLHSPRDFIVGGGLFAHFSLLPISLAWEAFGIANGAFDLMQMRLRVERYRRGKDKERDIDYTIGCILLERPFFFDEKQWIPVPKDWATNIVQGRTYDLSNEPGMSLWTKLQAASEVPKAAVGPEHRYGDPVVTLPRLGQGSFRIVVTDAYNRRCAMTNERTLPALEAAHIRPYSLHGEHIVENGLLLRRDLHALFDRGYITVTPELVIEVSRRIREEFENGRDYYRLHGTSIRGPANPLHYPSTDLLKWHNETLFRE